MPLTASVTDAAAGKQQRPDDEASVEIRHAPWRQRQHGRVAQPVRAYRSRRQARTDARPVRCDELAAAAMADDDRAGSPAAAAGRSTLDVDRVTPDGGPLERRGNDRSCSTRRRPFTRHHRGAERRARRALLAERVALVRLERALQHLAAPDTATTPRCRMPPTSKRCSASKLAYARAAASHSAGCRRCPARRGRSTSNTSRQHRLRGRVAIARHHARVGVLDPRLAALELPHRSADALQHVEWLEPRDDDRHMILARPAAGTASTPSRCRRGPRRGTPARGCPARHDRVDRRRHQHVRHQHGEVGQPCLLRQVHGHRVGRRRGLEPDAEEDHLLRPGFSRAICTASSGEYTIARRHPRS